MIISAFSILKATMTINVFNALLVNFKEGYLPFFCHALLFRVLSFAFIWVYLDRVVIVVFLLIVILCCSFQREGNGLLQQPLLFILRTNRGIPGVT